MPVSGFRVPTLTVHAPASNTAAVVTLSAPTDGTAHKVVQIDWSYDATPTGGKVTVAYGSTTYEVAVTVSGPGQLQFPHGVGNTTNQAVTVTLGAGGSGVTGKVNVLSF